MKESTKDLLKTSTMTALYYAMRVFPIKRNKVAVSCYFGKGYGDNPKYIVEELRKQDKYYDIVWQVKDLKEEFPPDIRKVKYNSVRSVYEMATARVWIDNCRKPVFVRKRRGQYYIMTWHSGIAFKKVEKDAKESLTPNYVKLATRDSRMANLFISGSKWRSENYRNAFWYDGKIAEVGVPKEDDFFRIDEKMLTGIREKLHLEKDTHIMFYAPTFRKSKEADMVEIYNLDWDGILDACKKRFGGEWIGMIRLHPIISNLKDNLKLPERVMDVTDYPDMQELLLVSDCLISDYSSCTVNFAMTGRPAFLYAMDLEEYRKDRDLYFQLEDLPFPLALDMQSLVKDIATFDEKAYAEGLDEFFKEKCGLVKGGRASWKVARIIRQVVYGKERKDG